MLGLARDLGYAARKIDHVSQRGIEGSRAVQDSDVNNENSGAAALQDAEWNSDAHLAERSAPVVKPPLSHHTPAGFKNNYASAAKSLRAFLRWQFNRITKGLPPAPSTPTPRTAAELKFIWRNAGSGTQMVPAVTWIGHATALIQASGLNILTDPIFSERASPVSFFGPRRAQAPGISLANLPHVDVVALSHNHYDHLDRESVRALARQSGGPPLFLVPLGIKAWLRDQHIRRAVELDWWDSHVYEGVEFHFTPAQHWSGRSLSDRNRTLWGAWAAFGEHFHWYFSGDTGYSADFIDTRLRFQDRHTPARGGGFDLALIAIGACEPRWFMQAQHVDPAEAVQIHLDLGAKRSVGVHWGTFALSDEPLDQPPKRLVSARDARALPESAFSLLAVGETRRFPARDHAHIQSAVGGSAPGAAAENEKQGRYQHGENRDAAEPGAKIPGQVAAAPDQPRRDDAAGYTQ